MQVVNLILYQNYIYALKECAETEYWLRLLEKAEDIDKKYANELIFDCLSIKKMLVSSINTVKSNMSK